MHLSELLNNKGAGFVGGPSLHFVDLECAEGARVQAPKARSPGGRSGDPLPEYLENK